MSKNVVIGIVALVVLGIGGWYILSSQNSQTPSSDNTQTTPVESAIPSASAGASMTAQKNIVSITDVGFSPRNITIREGESVTWENTDSTNHTVNSDLHPTHTLYPFLNPGLIKPGANKSVVFEKVGKYTYHDHLNPSLTGSVTVE